MKRTFAVVQALVLGASLLFSFAVFSAEHVNPHQAEIDALDDKKALLEAKDAVAKAENALAKSEFEALPEGFGKKGSLTLSGTDTVRVTAKAATAMKQVALKIADVLKAEQGTFALLTDADRAAIPVYQFENTAANNLLKEANALLRAEASATSTPVTPESASVLSIGMMLSQFAQVTQLFRTDKTVSFATTTLPEDLLLELVAANAPKNALYPAARLDETLSSSSSSVLTQTLAKLGAAGSRLTQIKDPKKKEAAATLVGQIDELLKRLMSNNEDTKTLGLFVALRGELASGYLDAAKGQVLSVRVLAQGGTTVKTESIWRSDRYHVSGNVVASYRLVTAESVKADIVASDSPFVRIPLE